MNVNKIKIGLDESGVGDYFGPLVACATVLYKEKQMSAEFQIKDSKKMDDSRLLIEVKKLQDFQKDRKDSNNTFVYHYYVLTNQEINQLYGKKIHDVKINAHHLKTLAHTRALANLFSKINNPSVELTHDYNYHTILDAFCDKKNWDKYQSNLLQAKLITPEEIHKINQFEKKADGRFTAVKLSSMIARSEYIKAINRISQKYQAILPSNLDKFPKGASLKVKTLVRGIKKKMPGVANEIIKLHFKI